VNQLQLAKKLDAAVEDCVNSVGVDVNTASAPLLSRVAGLSAMVAKSVVKHRDAHGAFSSREALRAVPGLGDKSFEQSAGFLRVMQGANPLDASAVHPESYPLVQKLLAKLNKPLSEVMGKAELLKTVKPETLADGQYGAFTVRDVLSELEKPGRDPRPSFKVAKLADGVEDIADLRPDMMLEGTVTNVAAFGAFIDIGVHQDGLVHVSQLADRFVSDAREVVKAGDIVKVRVVEVDVARKRIALTMKLLAKLPSTTSTSSGNSPYTQGRNHSVTHNNQRNQGNSGSSMSTGNAMSAAFAKLKR
jgi:protein Tex